MNELDFRYGDCFDQVSGLASLQEVDHFIMDPPYSERVHSKSMRGADGWKGDICEHRDLGFDPITNEQRNELATHAKRLVKRWVLCFSDFESAPVWGNAYDDNGLEFVRIGCWRKENGAPQFTGDRPAVFGEAIVIAHPPGKKLWRGGGKHGFWSFPIEMNRTRTVRDERVHPSQKPLSLMRQLILDFTDYGDLVCDPFSGSGTTGVACLQLGRRFVGWERDRTHYETALRRLHNTLGRDDTQRAVL